MKKLLIFFIVMNFIVINSFSEEILLNTEISSPYQIFEKGKLTGTSVKILECIFQKLNKPYKIDIVPWKRAQYNVKRNKVNGFFTTIPFAEADEYAVISSPIILEKWYFYYKDKKFLTQNPKNLKIGTIRWSNQSNWLLSDGYSISSEVFKFTQLLKMLNLGRIDTCLLDQKTFELECSKHNVNINKYLFKFCKYTPLGVYFSKNYLKNNPLFLKRFNEEIYVCAPDAIKLSKHEVQTLHNSTIIKIKKWMNNPLIINMVKSQNEKNKLLNQSEILKLDNQWRIEFKSENYSLIEKISSNSLSQFLKKIKIESNGLYSEIFVMDNKGLNIGQSDKTSDYWQGDEAKFQKTFQNKASIFVDQIEYDESSRKFQVQISFILNDPILQTPIGALTVGVDLEKALKRL